MTGSTNMDFTISGYYDKKLFMSAAVNQPAGRYMERDTVTSINHNNDEIVRHPTIDGLIRSGESQLLTEGSITIEFNLVDGFTAQQRANFETWLESNDEGMRDITGGTLTHDSENNKLVVTYTCEFGNTNWRQLPIKWIPESSTARLTLGANSSLACFLRIDDDPDAWTVRVKDIPSGATSTIDKAGETCYVAFSTDVTKDGTALTAYKFYKMTSSSFDVSAANDTKVMRVHRD